MEKKTIICIVGPSGSGKSFIATYYEAMYNVFLIQSRTTRLPRHEGEKGHMFVSNEEFDSYKKEDMLAFTTFGDNRYCCLTQDVKDTISTYVIDEVGLKYLRQHFSDTFNIFAIRVVANEEKRLKKVDKQRILRDKGKFNMCLDEFDYIIYNDFNSYDTYKQATDIYNQIMSYDNNRR